MAPHALSAIDRSSLKADPFSSPPGKARCQPSPSNSIPPAADPTRPAGRAGPSSQPMVPTQGPRDQGESRPPLQRLAGCRQAEAGYQTVTLFLSVNSEEVSFQGRTPDGTAWPSPFTRQLRPERGRVPRTRGHLAWVEI